MAARNDVSALTPAQKFALDVAVDARRGGMVVKAIRIVPVSVPCGTYRLARPSSAAGNQEFVVEVRETGYLTLAA